MWRTPELYWPRPLPSYRQRDFDTGFKREHGRSWRGNLTSYRQRASKMKRTDEDSQQGSKESLQEVGLDHSSDEVR